MRSAPGQAHRPRAVRLAVVLYLWCMASPAQESAVNSALKLVEAGDSQSAEAILVDALREFPGDEAVRFLYARVLAWNGRWQDSIAEYDALLSRQPDNADYLLGQARVRYWQADFEAALSQLQRARQLAPEYQAVWDLETRVLAARAGQGDRQQFDELVGQARVRWPEADWPAWPETPAPASGRARRYVEAGAGYQDLTDGLPAWSSVYVRAASPLGTRAQAYGGLSQESRFDERDTELRAGVGWPVAGKMAASVEASMSPGADVLPEWSLYGGLEYPLGQGYGLAAGWRHSAYASSDLDILTVAADKSFGDFRAAWTLYFSKLQGADLTIATQFRIDRYYARDNHVGLLLAVGRETESIGQGQFIEDDTVTIGATGLHRLNAAWAISWDVIVHDRSDTYRRGGFRVGLRRNF